MGRTDFMLLLLVALIFAGLTAYASGDLVVWLSPMLERWLWNVIAAVFLVIGFMMMAIVVFMLWVCSLRHKSDDDCQDSV